MPGPPPPVIIIDREDRPGSREVWQMSNNENVRILVVEDDPQVSELLSLFVKKYGYHLCGVAESGEDALRLIKETDTNLVFIDIVLKGQMNGIALARHITREVRIPFIYITGHSDAQIIEEVLHTRPSAFILKPFVGEELMVAVNIAMQKKK
jgi:DNA-binding NtrC family response regulator